MRSRRSLRGRARRSSPSFSAHWPHGPAARRHPRRSLQRQRLLSRREAVGADRLLFRLQRRVRLRPRHLPQRLVLRAGQRLQRLQGAGDDLRPTSGCARSAEAEVEALPILARGAALRFMLTRLVDWLNVPPGAQGRAEGSARISRQAALPSAGAVARSTTGSCGERARVDLDRRRLLGQSRPRRLGRDPALRRARERN